MASAAYQSIQVQIVDVYDGEWPGAGRGVAAAVLAGDVSLRGRGVLLRGEQAAGPGTRAGDGHRATAASPGNRPNQQTRVALFISPCRQAAGHR
jgi:hypothetical protein